MITDLDNTLYDWVAWYAAALRAMVGRAADVLGCDPDRLVVELRAAYAARGSVEEPRALLDLPAVHRRFRDRNAAGRALEPALQAFAQPHPESLAIFPGVVDSLRRLASLGIPVVGHTEATAANAVRRLRLLRLEDRIAALFAGTSHRPRESTSDGAPLPGAISPAPAFEVRQLGPTLAKPDPQTVRTICKHMGVTPNAVLYVGDNLERDVAMARKAGAWAAWARFGTQHSPEDWARLVSVTHWTAAQVRRAEDPRPSPKHPPHAVLHRSFAEVFDHFAFVPQGRSGAVSESA